MRILAFCGLALARVVQSFCNKRVSLAVSGPTRFFGYGAFYLAASALFALVLLCFTGFGGFDTVTLVCALIQAALMALELFSSLAAVKGGTVLLYTMFAMGGLLVPCIAGAFLFGETISVWQWAGLAAFLVSAWLLASDSTRTAVKLTAKTLAVLALCLLVNGGLMLDQKYFALRSGGNTALYSCLTFAFSAALMTLCFVLSACRKKPAPLSSAPPVPPPAPFPKRLFLLGALLALAVFSVNQIVTSLAFTVPSVVLFSVSSCVTIAAATVVGALAFGEKLSFRKLLGLAVGAASLVVINLL